MGCKKLIGRRRIIIIITIITTTASVTKNINKNII